MFTIAKELNSIRGAMSSIFVPKAEPAERVEGSRSVESTEVSGDQLRSRPVNGEGDTKYGIRQVHGRGNRPGDTAR